ncbi:MMPL family transporter [Clostridium sp. 19966]|uniref:MMPL family transporter n=1 Tax=Clostridium sp. 19966 TaxID=2768166 RepID=UPI0028DF925B|nr:MMPL family transporter [Clostridium sp. 19966]MDT8717807.1 MMPL family transporter [Clostridium sp. 19966]
MKKIIKLRWFMLAIWIAATAVAIIYTPDLNKVLRDKGQQTVSADNPSVIADNILKKMDKAPGNSDIIVFNSEDKLTDNRMEDIKKAVNEVKTDGEKLGISNMMDPFNMPEAKDRLISKDETTILVSFKLDKKGKEIDDIEKELGSILKKANVDYYLSGQDFINNDYLKAVSSGVDKSAVLTVFFILIVLIIMFRSVVTPLVSLFEVGIAFIISLSIVGQLVYRFNYEISSLTEMVMILILFGVGTDYNILLFNRFKEELSKDISVDNAIINTYKTAGKTVVFSIATVFIAFLSLIFAKFGIYRSGNCVAIAVMIFLLEILTLTPFLMKVLGKKLFWPSKEVTGHKENKLWKNATTIAVKKPLMFALPIVIAMVPIIYFNSEKLSFNSLGELGNSYASVKGFNLAADHFGKGESMPATVVIENDQSMDSNEALGAIDNITKRIKEVKGVKSVSSATEPLGSPIDQLYLGSQTKSVTDGISKTKDGVDQINNGIGQINKGLGSFNTSDLSQVGQLIDGTSAVQDGLKQLKAGMKQVSSGVAQGSDGAAQISTGIGKIKDGMTQLQRGTSDLKVGLSKIKGGYDKLEVEYDLIKRDYEVQYLGNNLQQLTQLIYSLQSDPELDVALKNNKNYQRIKDLLPIIIKGSETFTQGMDKLKSNYDVLNSNLGAAVNGIDNITGAQSSMIDGLNQLETAASQLSSGLEQGSQGQEAIISNMDKVTSALGKINDGQAALNNGLTKLASSMPALTDALSKSSSGLSSISDGLSKSNSYLTQLNGVQSFFVPDEAKASIEKSLDSFMTSDRKITKFLVVLDSDPYSSESMDTVQKINTAVGESLKGSVLKNAKYGVSGVSATNSDLNKTALEDLTTTKAIVLISVFVVLLIVIRSPLIASYITAALLASFYVSSLAVNLLVAHVFKLDGVSWNVPFFQFIMIVALGVDYSIFFMMRFKEYKNVSKEQAIILASKNIGGVIMSAALILGGTFITLIPAGIQLLTQLAIAVVIGLIALSILLLPVFLPALIALPNFVRNIFRKDKGNDNEISA